MKIKITIISIKKTKLGIDIRFLCSKGKYEPIDGTLVKIKDGKRWIGFIQETEPGIQKFPFKIHLTAPSIAIGFAYNHIPY